ncbi:MAG: FHA domain-containing protein [Actinomycetota bacterium]|nr:FHA domain-containing protein [Actinomycetota bacterium]
MAHLEIWLPDGAVEVPLEGRRVTVGRASDNDIVLDDPTVSRHHLVFERLAAGWSAHDVRSMNGTLVNGMPISAGRPLYDDDQLLLGDSKIVYRVGDRR